MEMRPFGRTGMQVSVLGLGAAEIGFEKVSDHTVDALLGAALDAGLSVIDTAAMYSRSEEQIGRALRGRRGQFLLFTKCGRHLPPRGSWLGFRVRTSGKLQSSSRRHDDPEAAQWLPRVLQWNIEQSLRRLNTGWIDLLQLHSCSEQTLRRGEVIEVLQRARQAGQVRYIGYSGDGPAALYAVQCGQFDALQTSINIADQEALDLTLPLARRNGMGVIAKRPLANASWRSRHRPEDLRARVYWDRLRELRYDFLPGGRDFETALRFALSAPGVHTAVVGTTDPRHLRRNVEFIRAGVLDEEHFDAIRARWRQVAQPDWTGQI